MNFTFGQARAYFEYRNPGESIPSRSSFTWRCPFHGDRTESMSVNLDKGGLWNCHACNIGGGLFEYEKTMFPGRTTDDWWAEIYKATGAKPDSSGKRPFNRGPVIATYDYVDPSGKLLFQKQRHEPKSFTQRAPIGMGGSGWKYSLDGVRKVLYRLPEVMAALVIFVVEGEKDADAIAALKLEFAGKAIAATCNFDGAGRWKDEYSPFFAGKRVVVFADNDDAGRNHAQAVAVSSLKHAESVKVVSLPGLPEKGDVYDYLQAHTGDDLLKAVGDAPRFIQPHDTPCETPFFVSPSAILPNGAPGIDWLIQGAIHRGSKGIFVAPPKAGKSMLALDLAVALSSGQAWLGIQPQRSVRVGVVSREDGPGMTMTRIHDFAKGRDLNFDHLPGLVVNTFAQRSTFSIERDENLEDLCKWIMHDGIEFCIFDVLNKLHGAEENDNTVMTAVMARFDRIREQTGADAVVIHHDSKNSAPGAKKPRGASAIDSWWDWKVSLNVDPTDETRKQVFFASKAGEPRKPMHVVFQSHPTRGMRILPLVEDVHA